MSGEAGYHYTLHPTGRRTRIEEDHSGRIADYDDLYRLTTEAITDPDNGDRNATYQYDATGNRIASTVNGESTSWSYDANDRLTIQSGPDGLTSYSYDANGNLVSETTDGETTNYRYDSRNRMVEVTRPDASTTGYAYDIHGICTEKTVQGNITRYLVDHNQQYAQVLAETDNHTPSRLYTRGDDLLSQTNPATNETRYHLHDGLGSTRALTDQTGNETDRYHYEAFGELLYHTGSSDNNYLFAGEQFDAALNHYYLRARYYAPETGRFTQMDMWQGIDRRPITLNKCIYADANPVFYTDPSGLLSLAQTTAGLNIQGTLANLASLSGRTIVRKAGCLVISSVVEQAATHAVYIFIDDITGKPYVGKTKRNVQARIDQHRKSTLRQVKGIVASFSVKGGDDILQLTEQWLIEVLGGVDKDKTRLSNSINAINEKRGRLKNDLLKQRSCK